jgi:stage III sporulation protein AG
MGLSNWIKKLMGDGKDTKLPALLLIIIAGVAVVMITGNWGAITPTTQIPAAKTQEATALAQAERDYEGKISNALQKIEGVGEVTVAVTVSSGARSEFGVNKNQTKNTQEETPTTGGKRVQTQVNDNTQMVLAGAQASGSQPVKIVEYSPQISGVLIVAEGAKDPYVKERVQNSVRTLLGIPANRIVVEPLSKGGK